MFKMFKTFCLVWAIAIALLAVSDPTWAQTVDTNGLNGEQIKQIQQQVNEFKTTANSAGVFDLKSMSEYVEVGKGVGAGIAAAAKELGMAVAEFASTGVGQVAVAILIYKVIGAEVLASTVNVLVAIAWTIFVTRTWSNYFRKICLTESVTETTLADGSKTVVTKGFDHKDGEIAGYRIVMFVVLIVAMLPAFFVYGAS